MQIEIDATVMHMAGVLGLLRGSTNVEDLPALPEMLSIIVKQV